MSYDRSFQLLLLPRADDEVVNGACIIAVCADSSLEVFEKTKTSNIFNHFGVSIFAFCSMTQFATQWIQCVVKSAMRDDTAMRIL